MHDPFSLLFFLSKMDDISYKQMERQSIRGTTKKNIEMNKVRNKIKSGVKIFYWWPNMKREIEEYVAKYGQQHMKV
jgi:hypothetical protein